MSKTTIRRAAERDIPKILELLVQVCMVHHNARPDLFKGPATKYTEDELRAILANDETPVFVCVNEADEVLGYAFCVYKQELNNNILTDIRTLYVDDICVDEACRGQHVGKTLCDYVLDFARREGFYNVTLNVWAGNPGAQAFYDRMGFKPQKVGMEIIL